MQFRDIDCKMLFRVRMTKAEGDIFWSELSSVEIVLWSDGGYHFVAGDATRSRERDTICVRLKVFAGPYVGEFVLRRGMKYGEGDISSVDQRFRDALRSMLKSTNFYNMGDDNDRKKDKIDPESDRL